MTIALVTISASTAINPAVMAELFPTGIRAAGLALPNAIAVALFGGTAPYLHTYFTQTHHATTFNYYAIGLRRMPPCIYTS
jgi:MHS family alpha-ketoglutarate permease-like MFS transporter